MQSEAISALVERLDDYQRGTVYSKEHIAEQDKVIMEQMKQITEQKSQITELQKQISELQLRIQ